MEVLVEIVVRLIESLMGVQRKPPPRFPTAVAPRRPTPPPLLSPVRPTAKLRRRPPASTRVAVAEPIVTLTRNDLAAVAPAVTAATAIRPTAKATAQRSAAADLRRRLTPANLRQQMLITEILRPPVALRDDR